MPKIGIISQARMTSTRLPGKVLKEISGKSLLQYHCERLNQSGLPLILATTVNKTDDPIVAFAEKNKLSFFRGSESDVLSRFYLAAKENNLDIIVRVTSDCPLIDGKLIKQSVEKYTEMAKPWTYMSNGVRRTFPRGFDFEVFSMEMLKEAQEKAQSPIEREHVTPYFYQNRHGNTQLFHIERVIDMSGFRLTVDEPDDFKMLEKLIVDYSCAQKTVDEICEVLQKHPELKKINEHIEQKKL